MVVNARHLHLHIDQKLHDCLQFLKSALISPWLPVIDLLLLNLTSAKITVHLVLYVESKSAMYPS